MEQAKEVGIQTILTSGQKNHCRDGRELLRELVKHEDGRIAVMVGSGVDAEIIEELQPYTGARVFHMSGKRDIESRMIYRKEGVNMGISSVSEFQIVRTDEDRIRLARNVLDRL